MTTTIRAIAIGASIGAAVSGGVLFAFSTFVMKALGRLPAPQAISAMQSINKFAPNPLFMTVLFGTAAACVPLSVSALRNLDDPSSKYVLIGAVLYIAGIVLTAAYHVPRNDALARIDPAGAGSAELWSSYLHNWTAWNHVRTATSIGGAIVLAVSTWIGRW
jgi:uncharacterized membrane protein